MQLKPSTKNFGYKRGDYISIWSNTGKSTSKTMVHNGVLEVVWGPWGKRLFTIGGDFLVSPLKSLNAWDDDGNKIGPTLTDIHFSDMRWNTTGSSFSMQAYTNDVKLSRQLWNLGEIYGSGWLMEYLCEELDRDFDLQVIKNTIPNEIVLTDDPICRSNPPQKPSSLIDERNEKNSTKSSAQL